MPSSASSPSADPGSSADGVTAANPDAAARRRLHHPRELPRGRRHPHRPRRGRRAQLAQEQDRGHRRRQRLRRRGRGTNPGRASRPQAGGASTRTSASRAAATAARTSRPASTSLSSTTTPAPTRTGCGPSRSSTRKGWPASPARSSTGKAVTSTSSTPRWPSTATASSSTPASPTTPSTTSPATCSSPPARRWSSTPRRSGRSAGSTSSTSCSSRTSTSDGGSGSTGYRVRYEPTSVVFHRHHATVDRYGSWRENYLLERNALFTIYKNYDETHLRSALPAAILLAIRRRIVTGQDDPDALDLRLHPGGDESSRSEVAKETLVGPYAVDAFCRALPALGASRRAVQAKRRRADDEISRLFKLPLFANVGDPRLRAELRRGGRGARDPGELRTPAPGAGCDRRRARAQDGRPGHPGLADRRGARGGARRDARLDPARHPDEPGVRRAGRRRRRARHARRLDPTSSSSRAT